MVRLTAWVSDEQKDWVETQAERHDMEQAAVIRRLIDAARYGDSPLDSDGESVFESVDDSVVESLRDDLAELEDRVDALEAAPVTGRPPERRENTPEDQHDSEDTSKQTTGEESATTNVDAILDGWPATGEEKRERRREVGRVALEWLRDRDEPASGSEFRDALLDDYPVEGQSDDTWWRNTVRPALKKAVDAGAVEYRPGHHDYQWVAK